MLDRACETRETVTRVSHARKIRDQILHVPPAASRVAKVIVACFTGSVDHRAQAESLAYAAMVSRGLR